MRDAGASSPVAPAASSPPAQPAPLPAHTGLVHVTDGTGGWRRVRRGDGFVYVTAEGREVKDPAELARIRALAIPPAWTDVWICPEADGHLQATGRDARGRKQYRYHADWQQLRGLDKFGRMQAFGQALPRLRARVAADLKRHGLPREKVLATIVRLLDTTFVRIGNDEYVRANRSFGLTTLRDRHATVRGDTLRLAFRGKGGVMQQVELSDPRVARIVRRCQDLPGQELFQYVDEDGTQRGIGSSEVNAYLREIGGDEFSAKDFRTWHATVQALELLSPQTFSSAAESKRLALQALTEVASRLGNTVAVCRKSYVHPQVLEDFSAGLLGAAAAGSPPRRGRLSAAERRLLAWLSGRRRRRSTRSNPGS